MVRKIVGTFLNIALLLVGIVFITAVPFRTNIPVVDYMFEPAIGVAIIVTAILLSAKLLNRRSL